jgi:hypothetical protein
VLKLQSNFDKRFIRLKQLQNENILRVFFFFSGMQWIRFKVSGKMLGPDPRKINAVPQPLLKLPAETIKEDVFKTF